MFTRGLPKKFEDFAYKQQVNNASTLMQTSLLLDTPVLFVDAEARKKLYF